MRTTQIIELSDEILKGWLLKGMEEYLESYDCKKSKQLLDCEEEK